MMSCEHCQPLILDHLYGLLDELEAVAVESHLLECESCVALRNDAARVQGLFARAAKAEFPQVRFDPAAIKATPPAGKTVSPSRPISAPAELAPKADLPVAGSQLPASGSVKSFAWVAWVIAASVLLAIPGTVIPVLRVLNRAETAQKTTEDSLAVASAAMTDAKEASNAILKQQAEAARNLANARQIQESLLAKWRADEKEVAQTARKAPVEVFKPTATQPGAPNDYWLVLRDHVAPNSRLIAEVRDQTDAVIYSQPINPQQRDNKHLLRLPAAAWTKLKPESELFLVLSSQDGKTDAKTELQSKIRLFGPVYATMLTTDRPAYRPGDTLYFRSLTLDRVTFLPPNHEQILRYELLGPHRQVVARMTGSTELIREGKGETIAGPDGKPLRGVGCGAFQLPADLVDGDYTLVVNEDPHPAGYPSSIQFPAMRSIKVRSNSVDVLTKQVGFAAASYSAGDKVEGWAEIKLEGRPIPAVAVKVVATADNLQLSEISASPTDQHGRSHFSFPLPRQLDRADVRLKVTFTFKGNEESIVERVPVIGHRVIVEFFPEGGTLIAGVPCRVYVRATTPSGHPVALRGKITDGEKAVAHVETVGDPGQPGANRGIGSFIYTPELATQLWLKLETPREAFAPLLNGVLRIAPAAVAGAPAVLAARSGFPLPIPEADGVVMTVLNPITKPNEPFRVRLQSRGSHRNLIVGAYTRGRMSDTKRVSLEPLQPETVELMSGPDLRGGVVRITVFEEPAERGKDIKPVAERLVFRRPGESLKLSYSLSGASTDGTTFAANSPIEMTLGAADEKNNPRAAILWAAAVNNGVEPGKKDRLATTHFLLAGEISTPDAVEYADFLLTDHPKAEESLDLVLATQWWRHFVEQTPAAFGTFARAAAPNLDRSRIFALNGQNQAPVEQPLARDQRKLYETYCPRCEAATRVLAAAQAANDAAADDSGKVKHIHDLEKRAHDAKGEVIAATHRSLDAAEPVKRLRSAGWYGVAGFGLLAVMLGAMAWSRPLGRLPHGIGTLGSVGLVAFLVVTLGMAERTQAAIQERHETIVNSTYDGQTVDPIKAKLAEPLTSDGPSPMPAVDGPSSLPAGGDAMAKTAVLGGGQGSKAEAKADEHQGKPGASLGAGTMRAGSGGTTEGPTMRPAAQTTPAPTVPPVPAPLLGGKSSLPSAPGAGPPPNVASGAHPTASGPGSKGAAGPSPSPPGAAPAAAFGAASDGTAGWHHYDARRAGLEMEVLSEPFALRQAVGSDRKLAGDAENLASGNLASKKSDGRDAVEKRSEGLGRGDLDQMITKNQAVGDRQRKAGYSAMLKDVGSQSADVLASNRVQILTNIPPLVVREYAAPRPGTPEDQVEIHDTILWQPVIVLPSDGKGKLSFQLGAAKGGYQVVVAGHTLDGRLGAVRGLIGVAPQSGQNVTPVTIPPKMP